MDENDLAIPARALLETSEAAYVTTVDRQGRPQTRAMFNLRNSIQFPKLRSFFDGLDDAFETWFTTNTSSTKMDDLGANRAVSVYYCWPTQFRGLMLGGDMETIVEPRDKARLWQDGWERYYPQGRDDPDFTVLRLCPTRVRYYHQFNTITLVG
jgi:general stress protein 26